MYCYSNNGQSMRAVDDNHVAQAGEVLFTDYATPEQLTSVFSGYTVVLAAQQKETANAPILAQIADLEAQGHRASRAVTLALSLGNIPDSADVQKLQSVETQIAALRATLQK